MRHVAILLCLILLGGCPGVTRLYVHNKSESTLAYEYSLPRGKIVTLRPGRSKWFAVESGQASCVEISIDGQVRAFEVSLETLMAGRQARYGSRMDAYYEHDRLFLRDDDDKWHELELQSSCQGL